MFTKKELTWMIIAIIILTFIIGFSVNSNSESANIRIIIPLLISILIILTSTISKKIAAPYFNIKIEHKIWEFQRYALYKKSKMKKPFPIGLLLPFFLTIVSLGFLKPLTLLQFDYKNFPQKRILKKYGSINRRRTEINETDPGYTATWSFYALLTLAIIGGIISWLFDATLGKELTKYTIYYGCWNLIPFGNLDGTKIFFGTLLNWAVLIILFFIIGLPITFIIV